MVMSPLSEKKINFHCHTDLINNGVQVGRKWEIITQRTLSLLFVPTSEQERRGSRGGSWGGYLAVFLTFTEILEKALKRQLVIDCLLIAERGMARGKKSLLQFSIFKKMPVHSCMLLKPLSWNLPLLKDVGYGRWDLGNLNSPKL